MSGYELRYTTSELGTMTDDLPICMTDHGIYQ